MLENLISRMRRWTRISDQEIFFREAVALIEEFEKIKFNIVDFYGNVINSGKSGRRLRKISAEESIAYLNRNFNPYNLGGSCVGRYRILRNRRGTIYHTIELEYSDIMSSSPVYSELETKWHISKKIRIDWLVEPEQALLSLKKQKPF